MCGPRPYLCSWLIQEGCQHRLHSSHRNHLKNLSCAHLLSSLKNKFTCSSHCKTQTDQVGKTRADCFRSSEIRTRTVLAVCNFLVTCSLSQSNGHPVRDRRINSSTAGRRKCFQRATSDFTVAFFGFSGCSFVQEVCGGGGRFACCSLAAAVSTVHHGVAGTALHRRRDAGALTTAAHHSHLYPFRRLPEIYINN